jgi:glycyl-tRNA synthetase
MDEIGTPFGITIDFDSLEDGTVTLRDRDSTKQERVSEEELIAMMEEKIGW